FFNKIKHSRRAATRYDKLASSFLGFVQLATIRCWIRFVHTTKSMLCSDGSTSCSYLIIIACFFVKNRIPLFHSMR
ncbi:MAG: transposase, partial [Methylobacterium sp.]|nr:transposase [Methylobacterium sp.]